MAVTLEMIHREIKQIQSDLHLLKHVITEEYELSGKALQQGKQ
jgi:hypothetical protein